MANKLKYKIKDAKKKDDYVVAVQFYEKDRDFEVITFSDEEAMVRYEVTGRLADYQNFINNLGNKEAV